MERLRAAAVVGGQIYGEMAKGLVIFLLILLYYCQEGVVK